MENKDQVQQEEIKQEETTEQLEVQTDVKAGLASRGCDGAACACA
jgi:hypothetical protein